MKALSKFSSGEKDIVCPHCKKQAHVYHLAWGALKCQHCGEMVNKTSWLVAAQPALAGGRKARVRSGQSKFVGALRR